MTWRDLAQNIGWSPFFDITTALSLAQALITSGAAACFADTLVSAVAIVDITPWSAALALALAAALLRLCIGNMAAYMAFAIPVAMATGETMGLNPVVSGMIVLVMGSSLRYFPAFSYSVFVFQQANIRTLEVFKLGLLMTLVAIAVLFGLALPYWGLLGESLTR